MKIARIILIILTVSIYPVKESFSQDAYKLWEGQEMPYYKENSLKEYEDNQYGSTCVYNINEPTLTVYKAQGENTGKAVVIIPGGGYITVCIGHEGHDIAKVLSKHGVTAAVLKYRLPKTEISDQPHLLPITDARKALSMLRKKAEEYGIDKDEVGVMGFSAGSHLSTLLSLWKSKPEESPDFSALIYGVTNINEDNMGWLEKKVYYRKMTDDEIKQNKLLELVSEDTPPTFLAHAYNDDMCHVSQSTLYAQKLFEKGVEVEMHLFAKGGHGFGVGKKGMPNSHWLKLFVDWMDGL